MLIGAFFSTGRRIDRSKRNPLDPLTARGQKRSRRRIVLGLGKHAEQFDIVRIEHDGVIARSHFGAVGPPRRNRKAKALPILRRPIEILDHDDRVIDADNVLERHSLLPPGGIDVIS